MSWDNVIIQYYRKLCDYVFRFIYFAEVLEEQGEYDELPPIKKVKQCYRSCMDEGMNFIFISFQYTNVKKIQFKRLNVI